MPRKLAAHFTTAEQAALAVVASEVVKRRHCELTIGEIAGKAGISSTTVKNALRLARSLGFVTVRERRISRNRNLPNVVEVVEPMWSAWLAHRGAPRLGMPCGKGGGKSLPRAYNSFLDTLAEAARIPEKATEQERSGSGKVPARRSA